MSSYRGGGDSSYRDSYRGDGGGNYRDRMGGEGSYRGGNDSYRGGGGGDSYRGGGDSYRGDSHRDSRSREDFRGESGGGYRGAPRHQPPPGDNRRIYVGNLPDQVEKQDLYDLFEKYGVVRDVQLKYGRTQNGTAYAFVEFERPNEAENAQVETDDQPFMNTRLRVELTGIRKRRKPQGPSGPPIRSDHRVIVTGLPQHCSWQDLKDFMRRAGPVGFASVEGDRGIVEYETSDGKASALRDLHKSEFRNPFGKAVIRVYEEDTYDYRGSGPSRDHGGRRYSNGSGDGRKRYRSASPRDEREPPHEKLRRYSDGRSGAPPPEERAGRYSPARQGSQSPPRSRSPQPGASNSYHGNSNGSEGDRQQQRGGGRSRSRSPNGARGGEGNRQSPPSQGAAAAQSRRSEWDDRDAE